MNQRRQQGGARQQERQQPRQQDNQPVGPTLQQQLNEIVRGVEGMRSAIEAVLPRAMTFGGFRSILMMAIRHNPDILTCNTGTIITSCMKAAYDGVMLDGKEAALIPSNNKVKIDGRDTWRREARYNIMVAGMRKQVLRGGRVRDLQTTVVYANEAFTYRRGLNPDLQHVPILDADKRGPAVGAYSVAWFVDGGTPSFEVMNRKQIEDVRDMAQSGPVWKGAMVDEMWRKTVLRRHRKSLPGGNDIPDMEARDDFPQFVQGDLTAHQEHDGPLPATQQSADAPRRSDFAALEHQTGTGGTPLDFGVSGEMTAEEVEREEGANAAPAAQTKAKPAPAGDTKPASDDAVAEPATDTAPPAERVIGAVPEGFETWAAWADAVVSRMKIAPTLPKLDAITAETQALFNQAPDEVQKRLSDIYEEKATDHREAAR